MRSPTEIAREWLERDDDEAWEDEVNSLASEIGVAQAEAIRWCASECEAIAKKLGINLTSAALFGLAERFEANAKAQEEAR